MINRLRTLAFFFGLLIGVVAPDIIHTLTDHLATERTYLLLLVLICFAVLIGAYMRKHGYAFVWTYKRMAFGIPYGLLTFCCYMYLPPWLSIPLVLVLYMSSAFFIK